MFIFCSSSECKPSQECESSDLKHSWEAQIEMEQSSCKDDAIETWKPSVKKKRKKY